MSLYGPMDDVEDIAFTWRTFLDKHRNRHPGHAVEKTKGNQRERLRNVTAADLQPAAWVVQKWLKMTAAP